ncbi:DUF6273 domain-containing protein [Collinsella sp. AF38-3AC]|uniref:DUF6273 domain-containing protein n=1 Tax=Collinsella sp. AF38-3AC TaxID=2292015 RepID=UPI000E471D28|nr:DUF6273 domain-containing protein [Collinsella sp. AF38-3AC]RHL25428.1 hypothetical protein DW029_03060 [Collinsella sp. AF38-3AC]
MISLTVAFAGPPVAGAIGNQFTAIAGAVGGSITGGAIGGIGGGTSGGTHAGGTGGGNHGTSGGTSGGGTTMKPGSGSTGSNTGTTGGGSSSGTVNPGSGSSGSQTTKPGQSGTNPGGSNTGSTGNTGTTGSGSSSSTTKPGSGSTGNTGSTGGNTGSTGSGNTSTRPSQPGANPTDGLENKDPKDWTLIDQKVVAEDISKNGTGSKYYPAAKKAMDEGTKWKTALLNGVTLEYKIIGINHDNLADGSGKAGLTFLTVSSGIDSLMNSTKSNAGGWKASDIRQKMNSGEIWELLPTVFRSQIKAVSKLSHNAAGDADNTADSITATTDKLFLLSYSEIVETPFSLWTDICPWVGKEGTQYEAFKGKVTDNNGANPVIAIDGNWYLRTVQITGKNGFVYVSYRGDPTSYGTGEIAMSIRPVFCF